MVVVMFLLRVSLSALLIVATSGFPSKGAKSTQQSGSGSSGSPANFASHRGGSSGLLTPSRDVPILVQSPSPQYIIVQADPALSSLSSSVPVGSTGTPGSVVSVPAGYVTTGPAVPVQAGYGAAGAVVPVQAGYGAAGAVVPVQAGYGAAGAVVPVQAGYGAAGAVVPVQAGYGGSEQAGAPEAHLPVAKWAMEPELVPAVGGSADSQAFGLDDPFYPAPLVQSEPVLQSGQTSNVVKEAELGNYQQQTEEFGYPADRVVSGLGFGSLVVPASGLGGYWGFPNPDFDHRLLEGSYPLGTYSTFSQHHEKGKDYYQSIHYLTEHDDDDDAGQVQQKKVFSGAS